MKLILVSFVMIATVFFLEETGDQSGIHKYENQDIPSYIYRDNTPAHNQMNDTIARLGRVLFYDKNLSSNNTISCASCHK